MQHNHHDAKTKQERLRSIRLSLQADEALHRHAHRRGDVKRRILEAVQFQDLHALDCASFRRPKERGVFPKEHHYVTTTVTMDDALYDRLREHAQQKDVSVAVLVERAILSHFDVLEHASALTGARHG
jgi:hypothetical protein